MESLAEIAKSAFVEAAGIEDLRRFDDLMGWHQAAWQAAADSVALPFLAEISQLRHDLHNEQAASRMAHEVVARNRALEAENAQLRHALANAQVAAGFAKEMAEKVKELEEKTTRAQWERNEWQKTAAMNAHAADQTIDRLTEISCGEYTRGVVNCVDYTEGWADGQEENWLADKFRELATAMRTEFCK